MYLPHENIREEKIKNWIVTTLFYIKTTTKLTGHCVKSGRIRSCSGPHFPRICLHSNWIRRDTPYREWEGLKNLFTLKKTYSKFILKLTPKKNAKSSVQTIDRRANQITYIANQIYTTPKTKSYPGNLLVSCG